MKLTRRSLLKRGAVLATGAALAPIVPSPATTQPAVPPPSIIPIAHERPKTFPGAVSFTTSSFYLVPGTHASHNTYHAVLTPAQRRQRDYEFVRRRGCWADLEAAVRQERQA